MRRAFSLFDIDGDGSITAREFRQGMLALNLNLRFDEIDDLMHLCDVDGNGTVSYDEFISRMERNIQSREDDVMNKVEVAFYQKL
jgi:calmodulin